MNKLSIVLVLLIVITAGCKEKKLASEYEVHFIDGSAMPFVTQEDKNFYRKMQLIDSVEADYQALINTPDYLHKYYQCAIPVPYKDTAALYKRSRQLVAFRCVVDSILKSNVIYKP